MAPSLRARDDAFLDDKTQLIQAKDETSINVSPWIIVAIIIGVILVVTIVMFVVVYFARRRRLAAQAAQQRPLSTSSYHDFTRKRKMSAADRANAEELERSLMIRKSLASRASSRSARSSRILESARSSRSSQFLDDIPMEAAEMADGHGLRDDWKEWEAGIQRERSTLDLRNPASQIRGHPALTAEPPQLVMPQQTRAPSPPRRGIKERHTLPLPPLPPPPPYKGPLKVPRIRTQ
ncbi:hypothetical protein BJ170DRAFT_685367 [Xylariales sp. AK1849]|nr:hypothetical protein BJ170DRAFT_685367 [Xylariales sp. AK1849]